MKLKNKKIVLSFCYLLLFWVTGFALFGLQIAISIFYSSSNLLMLLFVGVFGWGLVLIRNEFYALDKIKIKLKGE